MRDLSPNTLGCIYMALGSFAYVANDGLIRVATEDGLDVYQALFVRSCAMVVVFVVLTQRRGEQLKREHLSAPVILRVVAEVVGTATFFAALVRLEFANAQTILMLVPFVVTAIAARRGEHVSRALYLFVGIGFVGVIAVVRPTPDAFSVWSLLVVAAAAALVVREFATQRVDSTIRAMPIALLTAVSITSMMGVISLFTGWGTITLRAGLVLAVACACLVAGYLLTIETVRVGDLSVSAPFRYVAVLGAVVVGLVLFDERPDRLTLAGCALIVIAGIGASLIERQQLQRPAYQS